MDSRMLIIDVDPTTGEMFPVMPEDHYAETDGYNTPPIDMTRPQRRRFRTLNKKYRKTMPVQLAWAEALKAAMKVRA